MTALFQSGADEPLSYGLQHRGRRCRAGLTSGGVALSYVDRCEPDDGVGAGGHAVFTMALDASTGAWTFTLVRSARPSSLDELAANTENDLTIQFGRAGPGDRR